MSRPYPLLPHDLRAAWGAARESGWLLTNDDSWLTDDGRAHDRLLRLGTALAQQIAYPATVTRMEDLRPSRAISA